MLLRTNCLTRASIWSETTTSAPFSHLCHDVPPPVLTESSLEREMWGEPGPRQLDLLLTLTVDTMAPTAQTDNVCWHLAAEIIQQCESASFLALQGEVVVVKWGLSYSFWLQIQIPWSYTCSSCEDPTDSACSQLNPQSHSSFSYGLSRLAGLMKWKMGLPILGGYV